MSFIGVKRVQSNFASYLKLSGTIFFLLLRGFYYRNLGLYAHNNDAFIYSCTLSSSLAVDNFALIFYATGMEVYNTRNVEEAGKLFW